MALRAGTRIMTRGGTGIKHQGPFRAWPPDAWWLGANMVREPRRARCEAWGMGSEFGRGARREARDSPAPRWRDAVRYPGGVQVALHLMMMKHSR